MTYVWIIGIFEMMQADNFEMNNKKHFLNIVMNDISVC